MQTVTHVMGTVRDMMLSIYCTQINQWDNYMDDIIRTAFMNIQHLEFNKKVHKWHLGSLAQPPYLLVYTCTCRK